MNFATDNGRVRVAIRVRPRNAEDLLSDADFADCVELQPEVIQYFPLLFLRTKFIAGICMVYYESVLSCSMCVCVLLKVAIWQNVDRESLWF